jgi:hypothetical protein
MDNLYYEDDSGKYRIIRVEKTVDLSYPSRQAVFLIVVGEGDNTTHKVSLTL